MLETQAIPHWSSLVLRGIIAIIFGILAFWMPGLTLTALVILYGLYAAADGLVSLSELFSSSCPGARKPWLALMGLAGVGAAAVSFLWPAMTAMILLYIIGFWAIARGIFQLATWWSTHKTVDDSWVYALEGFVSIAFGVLLLAWPGTGALAFAWIVATYAIIIGVVMIAIGLTLKSMLKTTVPTTRV